MRRPELVDPGEVKAALLVASGAALALASHAALAAPSLDAIPGTFRSMARRWAGGDAWLRNDLAERSVADAAELVERVAGDPLQGWPACGARTREQARDFIVAMAACAAAQWLADHGRRPSDAELAELAAGAAPGLAGFLAGVAAYDPPPVPC